MTMNSPRPAHPPDAALSGPAARARCAALLELAAADAALVSDPAARVDLYLEIAAGLISLHGAGVPARG